MTDQSDEVTRVLREVSTDGAKFLTSNDPEARQALVESARRLVAAAETPAETFLYNVWTQPTLFAAARIAVALKLFETAVQEDGRPKTAAELAAPAGASPQLVNRIARACVTLRMLDEQEAGAYTPNDFTRLLTKPDYQGGMIFLFDSTSLPFAHLPEYFKRTNYQNPENPVDGPFQFGHQSQGHAFEWLVAHPDVFEAFHGYIHALRQHRPTWSEMYPVIERLVEGMKTHGDASAFVDVGGSTGQILQDFIATTPEYTGRLVLQELPPVIAAAESMGVGKDGRIELQAQDFFAPQPIKGARAYFLRSILHDWPDESCRQILGRIKDAMEPGYSRLLISECVLADKNAAWQHVALDIFMMALASSKERTETQWHELIGGCGLKITNIYRKGKGNESLIEVTL